MTAPRATGLKGGACRVGQRSVQPRPISSASPSPPSLDGEAEHDDEDERGSSQLERKSVVNNAEQSEEVDPRRSAVQADVVCPP